MLGSDNLCLHRMERWVLAPGHLENQGQAGHPCGGLAVSTGSGALPSSGSTVLVLLEFSSY